MQMRIELAVVFLSSCRVGCCCVRVMTTNALYISYQITMELEHYHTKHRIAYFPTKKTTT
jgi:hypothetical protein